MWSKGVKGKGEKGRVIGGEDRLYMFSLICRICFFLFILMLCIIKAEKGNLGKGMGPPGVRRENNRG